MTRRVQEPSGCPRLPLTRPNGKPYRARKVVVEAWEDDGGDCGCIVLGTHDIARAQPLADEACELWHGMPATQPECGWWRLTYYYGSLRWMTDPIRGRAGVYFTADDNPAATNPRSTT